MGSLPVFKRLAKLVRSIQEGALFVITCFPKEETLQKGNWSGKWNNVIIYKTNISVVSSFQKKKKIVHKMKLRDVTWMKHLPKSIKNIKILIPKVGKSEGYKIKNT